MRDLIDRKEATNTLRAMQTYKIGAGDEMLLIDQAQAMTELMMLPPAEPKRIRGKWRHYEGELECDQCGARYFDEIMDLCGDDVPRFCPNCGAKMEGEQDDR